MEWPKLKNIYICFPGGRHKVLTMSFDDGRVEDRRLVELFNRYGVRGTFNLNAGLLLDDRVPPRSEEHTSELQSPDNISYAVFCL